MLSWVVSEVAERLRIAGLKRCRCPWVHLAQRRHRTHSSPTTTSENTNAEQEAAKDELASVANDQPSAPSTVDVVLGMERQKGPEAPAVDLLSHQSAPVELVALEDQLPFRAVSVAQAADPMLFESNLQCASKARTIVKTYHRRPRSVAARSRAEAALQSTMEAREGTTASEGELLEDLTTQSRELDAADIVGPASQSIDTQARGVGLQSAVEEAKAATAAFLASVSQALQAPLATMPPKNATASQALDTPLRRSKRLTNQPLNSTVRASKKGEVLVMRKLGLLPDDPSGTGPLHPELASVFRGPLDTSSFAAMRDMFPAARALSDADLRAVAMQLQASDEASWDSAPVAS
ncbi:unnamed protein product [Urochloa humidicola]